MPGRRVSILCHSASSNALGRAWVFAELLSADYEIEVVAAARPGEAVWEPLRERLHIDQRWYSWSWPHFMMRRQAIARATVTGDLVIAVKPRLQTLGLALAAKAVRARPILLDIDDWDLGFYSPWLDALRAPFNWLDSRSTLHTRWYYSRATRLADAIAVSNRMLHKRFGGLWIPHARCGRAPETMAATVGKAEQTGVAGKPLTVMFVGTPRPHKGLGDLIQAFSKVATPHVRLRIVGAVSDSELARRVQSDSRISVEGAVPMSELTTLLTQAAIVVIPQRSGAASAGQLPAKLIDAMMLGRAIISTRVGDIPEWLAEGSGYVVPPNDPAALQRALEELLADSGLRDRLGQAARHRFERFASYDAVGPRLRAAVDELLSRSAISRPEPPFGCLPQLP